MAETGKSAAEDKDLWVYFELTAAEDEAPGDGDVMAAERRAASQVWDLLRAVVEGNRLHDEGHDSYSALVCRFLVTRGQVPALQERILELRGGGDDILYLDDGFQASQFAIVERPGLSKPVPFDDWDDYLDEAEPVKPRAKRRGPPKSELKLKAPLSPPDAGADTPAQAGTAEETRA